MPVEWLSQEKCKKMLPQQVYGRLATAGKDGMPYITPLNYVYINDSIYFHTGFRGKKINNINENPAVCFEISAPGNLYISDRACGFSMRYWCILVSGRAEPVTSPEEKADVLDALMKKYASRYEYSDPTDEEISKVNIIKINVENISGKLSVDPQP